MIKGIDENWFQGRIADSAYELERTFNSGERVIVGVSGFTEGNDDDDLDILRISNEDETRQRKRLDTIRQERDQTAVDAALAKLRTEAADPEINLMPTLIEASHRLRHTRRDDERHGRRLRPPHRSPRDLSIEANMSERILVAKVGLDGHDRGIKVVARILRDAGYEVIYTGLFQTPQTVASAAVDEDVDAIGLSMLSGAHMTLAPLVVDEVRKLGSEIPVVVGGIVPNHDVAALLEAGIAAVITPGASADQVVETIRSVLAD